jgi:hypothetical protein
MTYTIDTDDFLPECSNVRYPLLRAIHSEFNAAYIDEQGDKKWIPRSIRYALEFPTLFILFKCNENLIDNFNILHRNKQRTSAV